MVHFRAITILILAPNHLANKANAPVIPHEIPTASLFVLLISRFISPAAASRRLVCLYHGLEKGKASVQRHWLSFVLIGLTAL
jgi:hypothetical protein